MRSRSGGNSVSGSWINGPNIQIGSAGNVTLALGRANYQVQWLEPAPRDGRIPRRQRTPSYLLDARREVVPFWPRPHIQNRLVEWRDDPDDPASVLLVHGAGGQGKTRLANAFAGQCHESGWAVARAVSRADSPGDVLPDGPSTVAPAGDNESVLVVVDYAERWPLDTLAELIRSLVLDFSGKVLRILLLARSRGQLWQTLNPLVGRHIDLLDPVELGGLTVTRDEREEAFDQAALAFQKALELPPSPSPVESPDLSHDDYGSPLMLHMAALATVTANHDHEPTPGREDLSGYLLEHERRHWPLTAPTTSGVTPAQASDSVFLATLLGPLPGAAHAAALMTAAGITDQQSARTVLAWHDTLYPQDQPRASTGSVTYPALAPLRPDRFGEDFIAERLTTDPRATELLHHTLTLTHGQALLDENAIRRCLIVLAAVADRHPPTRTSVWALLDDYRLARRANATVIQTAIDYAPLITCQALETALPRYRIDLLQAAAALTTHILSTLPHSTSTATRARYLSNLGVRLAEAGNIQGALAPAREAVARYKALAEADPDAHLPNLASSLNNLGNHLAEAGDKQAALAPAQEAVTHYKALAEADPDAHLPDLAMSQSALAWGQTQETGQNSNALEEALAASENACRLYGHLAEKWPNIFDDPLKAAQATRATIVRQLGHTQPKSE